MRTPNHHQRRRTRGRQGQTSLVHLSVIIIIFMVVSMIGQQLYLHLYHHEEDHNHSLKLHGGGADTLKKAHGPMAAFSMNKNNKQIITTIKRSNKEIISHGKPIWVFFYLWYGTPEVDGKYWHWTHPILPHWDAKIAKKYPSGIITAPNHVASPNGVKPKRGLYSSSEFNVLSAQMKELKDVGVTGCITSWWGRNGNHDDNGPPSDPQPIQTAFEAAELHDMKISIHLEPYKERTAQSVCEDITYLVERYGSSNAWDDRIYVYDSYITNVEEWAKYLPYEAHCPHRKDVKLIALILAPGDVESKVMAPKERRVGAGPNEKRNLFDGIYTYFAAEGFTKASTPSNWRDIESKATKHGLTFVPCVGPGYDDTAIRPWNEKNKRDRRHGRYFKNMWKKVPREEQSIDLVAITSFNEWAEGTMIEATDDEEEGDLYMNILKEFQW